jgi:hypothetical protein
MWRTTSEDLEIYDIQDKHQTNTISKGDHGHGLGVLRTPYGNSTLRLQTQEHAPWPGARLLK